MNSELTFFGNKTPEQFGLSLVTESSNIYRYIDSHQADVFGGITTLNFVPWFVAFKNNKDDKEGLVKYMELLGLDSKYITRGHPDNISDGFSNKAKLAEQ